MLKSIKNIARVVIITITTITVLILMLLLLLSISPVQTIISKKLSEYISEELNTTISVDRIKYTYFNRLNIANLLIKDKNQDTLIYIPLLRVSIRKYEPGTGSLTLGRIIATRPQVSLITDSTGVMNLTWYLDKFRKKDSEHGKGKGKIEINRIDLNNGRFRLVNITKPHSKTPVDFNNLQFDSLYVTVTKLNIAGDSVKMDIKDLRFRESSGFEVKNFSSELSVSGRKIIFYNSLIESDSSLINAPVIALLPDSVTKFRNFESGVGLQIQLTESKIACSELRYLVPLKTIPSNVFNIKGTVTGTISELKGRNISIAFEDNSKAEINISLSGLPDINNTFIFFEIKQLETFPMELEKLKIPGAKPIIIPDNLRDMGKIAFSGSFTGFITDFVTYGRLYTDAGIISSDISLRPEGAKRFRIKGLMKCENIDAGRIAGNADLFGKSTLIADINGETESFKTFAFSVNGKIDSIEINKYKYRDITLNGYFTEKTWDGTIKAEDENIRMELLGMFDFSKELPEFDFTLNLKNADLYRLNIDKKDSTSAASLLLTANFRGNNIDNLDGEIKLLNSSFRKYGQNLEVYDFSLKTFSRENVRSLLLNTDFFDMEINGDYNFATLGTEFKKMFSEIFPSRFSTSLKNTENNTNNFRLKVNFKNINALNNFLKTGLSISENSIISGFVQPDSIIHINGTIGTLGIKNNYFSNLSFDLNYNDSLFKGGISTSSLSILNLTELKNFKIGLSTFPDHFQTAMEWDDRSKVANRGTFKAEGEFVSKTDNGITGKKYYLKLGILPGEIYVRNNKWDINPAEIIIDTNSIKISRFLISSNENYFSIEGSASHDRQDTIYIKLNNINISGLNNLYEKKAGEKNTIHLAIGGILSGTISLTDIYRNFMFESNIRINNFALLESNYGTVTISSAWNKSSKVADIEFNNNIDGRKTFDITGYYDPENRLIDLTARADRLPVEILNPLLKTFASDISGMASGKVRLLGEPGNITLTGSLYADNSAIKIDYLQTKYRFSDSIRFDKNAIRFNNIVFRDERGNTGSLNGSVYHKNFKDYSVDLTVRTNGCMVLNTREKDNEIFYGTAFASGVTTIKTIGQVLRFDISARTGRNTRFFIPINTGMSVAENTFVSFISSESEKQKEVSKSVVYQQPQSPKTALEMAFDLEVTPDAEIQLIMDPKAGDIMKGSGSGNLNLSLDRKGVFKIFGDYTIESGDYLFTLGNIINKSFTVQSGGKITFNGELDRADIDIKAVYRTKASLYEIMPGMLSDEKLKERIPVECLLILTGKLFNPVVGFDINLPTADEETRAYLRSMIKSEEEMSKQFLFLLVMNSFYADPSAGIQTRKADIGSATVGVTTMEMLSNQLSNWLSQISKDFDIGVVYRPGSSALPNSQELQVALSTQLLNDRVTINGNFDVAGNQAAGRIGTSSTNTITGAFDIEYKISERLRFKFFNRSNDNLYIDNGVQYTQGIGIFYKQDFDRFRDLFVKKEKSPGKKEEEVKVVDK